jgi:hypothetical protein
MPARAPRPTNPGAAAALAMTGAARRLALPTASGGAAMPPPRPLGPTMTVVRGTRASQEEFVRGY